MQRLEDSGAVRPLQASLGVKGLSHKLKYQLLCQTPHRYYSVLKYTITVINFLHYFKNYII